MKAEEARAIAEKVVKPREGYDEIPSFETLLFRIEIAARQGDFSVAELFLTCDYYAKELKELGYKVEPLQMMHYLIRW